MTAQLHSGVVRLWHDESVVGTGFLVRGVDGVIYALTCAHVVNVALGRDPAETAPPREYEELSLDLPLAGKKRMMGLLRAWIAPAPVGAVRPSPVADIAVARRQSGWVCLAWALDWR